MTEIYLENTECPRCRQLTLYKVTSYMPEDFDYIGYYCKTCDWSVEC